jgi:hypothetical protein
MSHRRIALLIRGLVPALVMPSSLSAQTQCPAARLSIHRDAFPLRAPAVVMDDAQRIRVGELGQGLNRVPWSNTQSRAKARSYKITRWVSTTLFVGTLTSLVLWERESRATRENGLGNPWTVPTVAGFIGLNVAGKVSGRVLRSAVRLHNAACPP